MNRIAYADEAGTQGRMIWEGGEIFGPLPPESAEYLPIYERLLSEGVTPEPLAPVDASAVPPDITDGQFGRGLWEDGVIPYEEYIGFVGAGILPSTLEALLLGLADDDTGRPTPRKIARGDLMGRTRFIFANPLVETIRQLMAQRDPIWTPAHLRERWLVWADL